MGIYNLQNVINIQSTSSPLQSKERGQTIATPKKKPTQKPPPTTNHPKVSLLPGIKYIQGWTEARVSVRKERQRSTSTQLRQAGGPAAALAACRLPAPTTVYVDNKTTPSHSIVPLLAPSSCRRVAEMSGVAKNLLCTNLLGIQMLPLPGMKKNKRGKQNGQANKSRVTLLAVRQTWALSSLSEVQVEQK